jgi:parvulin-like peptidyl-prolyl isomerase
VKRRILGLGALAVAVGAWVATAQEAARPRAAAPPADAGEALVATVGSLRVTRSEFEQRSSQLFADIRARSGAEPPKEYQVVIRRQLLETIIRHRLLMLEAERQGPPVGDAEAEAALKRDPAFLNNGEYSEARFLAFKGTQPEVFKNAMRLAKLNLSAQRLNQNIERQNMPEEAAVRARSKRRLTRVWLEALALRRLDFESGAAEPLESEILGYYRSHPDDFRGPARAYLTVVFVNQPRLADSLANRPDPVRAWQQSMRARADSALAQARRGASVDTLGARLGGLKRNVAVSRDRFPDFWSGEARSRDAVFQQARGAWLSEPIASPPGWMLVRVDEVVPAGVVPFVEAAPVIRAQLRENAARRETERRLRAVYEQMRDSLRGPAYRIRYATADSATFDPGAPSAAELERFYRSRLADYSSFDPARGQVVARPLAQVRDEVRERWRRGRRADLLFDAARRLQESWDRDRRDAPIERRMTSVREVGPIPIGGAVDTGLAGRVLTDTLAARGYALGTGVLPYPRGQVVYQVVARVEDQVPSFEAARPMVEERSAALTGGEDVEGAKRLFESDPDRFRLGNVVHFSRLVVSPEDPIGAALTRREVVEYRDRHIEKYSAPELVTARHILVMPKDASPAADTAARRLAESLRERVQAGEDFSALAAEYSDDVATRHGGGDLGQFGRGVMLPQLERLAFTLQPGEIGGPVRSQVGYHVVKCTEHLPQFVQPLMQTYANIGADAAREKVEALCQFRADSIYRASKTPAQALEAARRLGLDVIRNEHAVGSDPQVSEELAPYIARLETLKPGQFYPGVQRYRSLGYVVTWVDSITPPRTPTWDEARPRVLAEYRLSSARRAMAAKCAEIDSMLAAGWTADSLASLWGGWVEAHDFAPGQPVPLLGTSAALDSLVFGVDGSGRLEADRLSPWLDLPSGRVRVRIKGRREPNRAEIQVAMESDRRASLERALLRVFEDYKRRYPVRILDNELRTTRLPPLPDS